jgi:hypothetical protein
VVAKLLAEGLVEEVQSRGSLPVWRRDGDNAHTLRITKRGLRVSPSFLRTTPAKKPRTECCCHPVVFMMAAIVAPCVRLTGRTPT